MTQACRVLRADKTRLCQFAAGENGRYEEEDECVSAGQTHQPCLGGNGGHQLVVNNFSNRTTDRFSNPAVVGNHEMKPSGPWIIEMDHSEPLKLVQTLAQ